MSDYTPTTEEVAKSYVWFRDQAFTDDKLRAEFDCWLAEVKADAWDEGYIAEDIGPDMRASNPYRHLTENPYRQGD